MNQATVDFIKQWLAKANEDLLVVERLTDYEIIATSAVCYHCQQAVEKFLKAFLIANSIEIKRTHNLIHLLSTTPIELSDDKSEFMLSLNRFQLEGRYPDYLNKMHNICNEPFTTTMINETNKLRLWLLEKVQ